MTTPSPAAVLRAEGITRTYGKHTALSQVSLSVFAGEVTALLGANGAGKTTLLRVLAGLTAPDAGQVHHQPKGPIGWLGEHRSVRPGATVRTALQEHADIWQVPSDRVIAQIGRFGLHAAADVAVHTLSKGWRQRVGLALATLPHPKVLLLDEPFSGLDPQQRDALGQQLRALAEDGVAVVVSSHALADLSEVADRVAVLVQGRCVATLRPDDTDGLKLSVEVARDPEALAQRLRALDGVQEVQGRSPLQVRCTTDARPHVARLAAEHDLLHFAASQSLRDRVLHLLGEARP